MVWLISEKLKYLRKVASLEGSITNVFSSNTEIQNSLTDITDRVDLIEQLGGGISLLKGIVEAVFNQNSEVVVAVSNVNITSESIVSAYVLIENDEILIQDFQIQVAQEIGVGFKIYCRPKVGWHTGTVKIKYLIL